MKFTQFVIIYYKEWILVNIDMLQYIKEKAISWDVYKIFQKIVMNLDSNWADLT